MEDALFWFNVLMRWLHVAAAVAGVGGTIAMRFVVLPALERASNGAEVLNAIRPGFKKLIHSALGLLLITGFYNYLVVAAKSLHKLQDAGISLPQYHAVMGIKILLSLALFTIAILLLKPVPSFHENRKSWLSVNVVLGLVILLLAGYLRRIWPLP